MSDAFKNLYDDLASRKEEYGKVGPYTGGNGRIDRAVDVILGEGFPTGGALLDVGGATGNLGYALRDNFEDRYVLEIAEACRKPAESKGNKFRLQDSPDGVSMSFASGQFQLIAALDFIEHILDPEAFARECFRVLGPGGRVLINTPNIQFWRHLHSLVIEGHFPHTSGDREVYHGGHVAFYNQADLMEIFEMVGFRSPRIHVTGLTADPPPPIWTTISRVPAVQMSYSDLVFSAVKP